MTKHECLKKGWGIATALMISEAQRRLASGVRDDSELYDGQLAAASKAAFTFTAGNGVHARIHPD